MRHAKILLIAAPLAVSLLAAPAANAEWGHRGGGWSGHGGGWGGHGGGWGGHGGWGYRGGYRGPGPIAGALLGLGAAAVIGGVIASQPYYYAPPPPVAYAPQPYHPAPGYYAPPAPYYAQPYDPTGGAPSW